MANHERPTEIIDLTQSFTRVDHSSLANTVIELDDSLVLIPDSPEVRTTAEFSVTTQPVRSIATQNTTTANYNALRSNTSRSRLSKRQTASTQTANGTVPRQSTSSLQQSPPKSKIARTKAQTHANMEANDSQSGEQSSNGIGHCPICFEKFGKNPLTSTKCGHVFCSKCLEQSFSLGKKCPTCRRALKGSNAYHRLFLTGD